MRAVALLLPGGSVSSHRKPMKLAAWGMRALAGQLAERGRADGIAVHMLTYRFRGWNGEEASTAADAEWAVEELRRRYGDVPVALVGNSLGGRAAFWAAGHPHVVSVAGIAPWLPGPDPVEHLVDRKVLIVHGDKDRSEASAEQSLAYAERVREITPDVCRFEVGGGNHYLLSRAVDVWAITSDFVLGTLFDRPLDPAIVHAMAADDGLRKSLAVGFGR